MGTVRDLLPSERTPRGMLSAMFNPTASQLQKDAELETFTWPWEPLSFVILSILDSLKPDRAKGEEAAVRYLNSREPTPIPIKASILWPLSIIMIIVISLGVIAWARG